MKKYLRAVLLPAASLALITSLAACAQTKDTPFFATAKSSGADKSSGDDDAYCRANSGAPGTSAYAACLKDRDVGAIHSSDRMEQAHRNLAESMLNGH